MDQVSLMFGGRPKDSPQIEEDSHYQPPDERSATARGEADIAALPQIVINWLKSNRETHSINAIAKQTLQYLNSSWNMICKDPPNWCKDQKSYGNQNLTKDALKTLSILDEALAPGNQYKALIQNLTIELTEIQKMSRSIQLTNHSFVTSISPLKPINFIETQEKTPTLEGETLINYLINHKDDATQPLFLKGFKFLLGNDRDSETIKNFFKAYENFINKGITMHLEDRLTILCAVNKFEKNGESSLKEILINPLKTYETAYKAEIDRLYRSSDLRAIFDRGSPSLDKLKTGWIIDANDIISTDIDKINKDPAENNQYGIDVFFLVYAKIDLLRRHGSIEIATELDLKLLISLNHYLNLKPNEGEVEEVSTKLPSPTTQTTTRLAPTLTQHKDSFQLIKPNHIKIIEAISNATNTDMMNTALGNLSQIDKETKKLLNPHLSIPESIVDKKQIFKLLKEKALSLLSEIRKGTAQTSSSSIGPHLVKAQDPDDAQIISFYSGSPIPETRGDCEGSTLDMITQNFSDEDIERKHNFIQWLFPTQNQSGAQPISPWYRNPKESIQTIKTTPDLQKS
jgi:hypothetical protein